VQLALVQKKENNKTFWSLWVFPSPPTNHYGHPNLYSINSRKSGYLPEVSMEDGEKGEQQ
jgi:hypothetical protein